jgi:hypothetical protein
LLTIVPPEVPLDVTSLTTLVVNVYPEPLNVAVQPMLLVRVTLPSVQSALPVQPAKLEPEAGVATRFTFVPLLSVVVHVLPQLIPAGLLVTVPLPVPVRFTVSVYVVIKLNTAVQLISEFIVTLPLLQADSDQPAKVEPLAGAAARATAVPPVYTSVQSLPHVIPAGELVIVPLPVPERPTLIVKLAARVVPQISFV